MTKQHNEPVPDVPGLYQDVGKRRTLYFCKPQNKYTPLGYDLEAAKVELARLKEAPVLPGQITVRQMCLGYIAEQREYIKTGDKQACEKSTIDVYEYGFLSFVLPVFGRMHPDEVTPNHIAKYLKDGRKNNRSTRVNREKAALSSAYKYGMSENMAKSNPTLGVSRNKEIPRKRLVSIAEFNDFLEHARKKGSSSYMVALIGCTVAMTGRRRAEILHLTKAALLPEGFKVQDCKNSARHYLVAWSDILRQIVSEAAGVKQHNSNKLRAPSIYLFGTEQTGAPYTDSGFKKLWNVLMHSYAPQGVGTEKWFTAHDLRALYVSEMKQQERDPNTHQKKETMDRVYDRRDLIRVVPLA
jgi:integrase